ncbi:hypothetical protein CAP36_12890 [Chitinophagaceae bacterium IBVUCB2]|nr:hypothetical protein CAP36_12890 [Chitinophagaceae bacterium IBVUCB2]
MKKILVLFTISLLSNLSFAQSYKGDIENKSIEQKLNDEYCTGLFKSADGQILDVASNISSNAYFNILDWLQGRVAGVQIYKSRTGVSIPVIRGTVPGIYVDEMPVSLSYLNSLPIFDIAIIKIIRSPFMGGFNGSGGAIAIYTVNEEEDDEETDSK